MNQKVNQYQQLIGSYTGKLLRDHFGKGPESISVSMGGHFVTMYLRNFLTPSERVLLEQDHEMIIHQMREKLTQMMIPEITSYIQLVTGVKPSEFYYDWALHNKSGMLVGFVPEGFEEAPEVNENYEGKQRLEQEINKISRLVQREPDEIYSCELNARTILIIRKGILVRIEKELIRLGHGELLKGVKRNLEKTYMHNNNNFDEILNRQVLDSFADWNYSQDKSVMMLVTQSK
ncbi:hypothetical protein PM3016_6778 [Paenibacillus mucilaginosus 3016]|uniref:Na+-translocating membrane potential-generating system MpsC domain-containing protein n=2 Tax=Paenibacillus mucilaginosus TaxID=61624 RepID=H6NPM8_9BACL|nr:Na-translocating system protein MpsC family protein [Paenibacillus mucilaginosus]AFC33384.1 hypothetical protein PM3016_6778 [Paenibacillus mucilaginosus 3016]AFH65694.1 hypothetical protein B2K_34185 [Paenibacillus mucilaginosus K02]WFA21794.1 DUF2294 family protein [Paenibacillus mucilaginosus]